MFNNLITLRCTRAAIALAVSAASVHVGAVTPLEMMQSSREVRAINIEVEKAKARSDLAKLGELQAGGATVAKPLTPERSIDDGIVLLSVTGPSANPTYLVQFRGVPMPLKVGDEAMDGWTLDSVTGNRMHLVRKVGKRVAERRTVMLTDTSYAQQREQQRVDAAKLNAQPGAQSPFMMQPPNMGAIKEPPTP
ncbi:hypothetical protein [Cupriavidus pampae]|jgi:hypothetical protein|uniref:Type IV pilus biogenesis protein PilP n=1 Tax=Cupriavidus pampae TaxID=659251 RepID=A0ABN7ZJ97_9BURK|nr:hypothetical protein [Cupriavidus pampae]CAG9184297.1 hypothetical protein LMG32289_05579 [Cupriavidus pampae]